ncbi:MAG TPA: hypothetical protein VL463_21970 [Kofleriaceae bacterium]|nr:hypothetical protein [Kofleriaceae bacterium]
MKGIALAVALAACSRATSPSEVIVQLERGHTIYTFAGDARGLAWQDGHHGDNHLRYQAAGAAPIEIAATRQAMVPIAVDDRYVYWGGDDAVQRWSRADHRAEVVAPIGRSEALLLDRGTLWIGAGRSVARVGRDGAVGTPVAVAGEDLIVGDLVELDGRVVAIAKRYDPGRTQIVWADRPAAPLADLPWAASTVVSDGHSLYLSDWHIGQREPIDVWSMTATSAPAKLPDLSDVRDTAVTLIGADAHGLYLCDGTRAWRRDPDGTMHELGRRVMHGELAADGTIYGTTHDDDRREQLVKLQ